jgi:hypothetical protein
MKRQLRDLQKLYKFANDRNIVIEEVDRFSHPHTVGCYLGRFCGPAFDTDPTTYFNTVQDIHILIKLGLNPAVRLAVIAHEIGHDNRGWELSGLVAEKDAWQEGERLLKELNIKITPTFSKFKRQHLQSLVEKK